MPGDSAATPVTPPVPEAALAETRAYLGSAAALESIAADPYWPKWSSPWWRMTLLHELGLAREVPAAAVDAMVRALRTHYLPDFPLSIEDIPTGKDPQRHVACHCAVGTIWQVLAACGVDVDAELPWIRPWLLRYQLEDGGLNCDEAAYTRARPRSSIVSTLPPLEAMLRGTRRPLTQEEARFLDQGARYVLDRRLCRSTSRGGALMDPAFLEPCFPRFYDYDVLRGLTFVLEWAEAREAPIPRAAIAETLEGLEARASRPGGMPVARRAFDGARTVRRDASGDWTVREAAATFPLLEAVSAIGAPSPSLDREWREAKARLARVQLSP